ncbi:anti-sigma factor [soil metagenome]
MTPNPPPPLFPPITEAELHALVDGQLTAERQREIEAALASRPDEALRVEGYRAQKRELRALFDPVLDEAPPQRVLRAARPRTPWYLQRLAAGIAIALVSGATGWGLHGGISTMAPSTTLAQQGPASITMASATGFAQRAAVAHAVYSPEQRRPVEVDAAHEDQLIAWLSKRMGAPMKPPHLQAVGYALEGGRLLPGGQGPVAQFMYRDESGSRLTLYVSNEIGELGTSAATRSDTTASTPIGANQDTAFRFAREGKVNVFYWVEGPFGYAISADADRAALARVSGEVYRQLNATVR